MEPLQNQIRRPHISLLPEHQPLRAARNTSKKTLEARKRALELELEKVSKMLELINQDPNIEVFLELDKG